MNTDYSLLIEQANQTFKDKDFDRLNSYATELLAIENSPACSAFGLRFKGHFELEKKNTLDAIKNFEQSLVIFLSLDLNEQVAETYYQIALGYRIIHELKKGIEYYQKAIQFFEVISPSHPELFKCYFGISQHYFDLPDYAMALEYGQIAQQLAEESQEQLNLANITNHLGCLSAKVGSNIKALEHFERSIKICEASNFISMAVGRYANVGILCTIIGKHEAAFQYFSKALELNNLSDNKIWEGNIYDGLAGCFVKQGDYNKALEFQLKSQSSFKIMHNIRNVITADYTIGTIYVKMKRYDEALQVFENCCKQASEIDYKSILNNCKFEMADLYANPNYTNYNAEKAKKLYEETLVYYLESGSKRDVYECYKSISLFFEQEKQWEEAFKYYKLFIATKDEAQNEETAHKLAMMEVSRKVEEAERDRQVKLAGFKAKENILHRVLPAQIAERIAEGETEIADYFPTVSILFADIEGFTPMSADMPAHIVVKFLNHVFSHFDHIMKKYGCEKIKTIGDGYMAVAGAPTVCDDHAERLTNAALEMLQAIELPDEVKEFIPAEKKLSIRIGLHTGSVVAGVVGKDRFVYDIYSDAVNTAARMESHGENGKIHITSDFMKHLSNRFSQTKNTRHGIRFESRGEMEVKGKGMMKTYFLENLN